MHDCRLGKAMFVESFFNWTVSSQLIQLQGKGCYANTWRGSIIRTLVMLSRWWWHFISCSESFLLEKTKPLLLETLGDLRGRPHHTDGSATGT